MKRAMPQRYGVISDIHGNLHALEATLHALKRLAVERYICAGDIVGYGPLPNECLEAVHALPGVTVAGNHDLMVIGMHPIDGMPDMVRATQQWTRGRLTDRSRRMLEQLPILVTEGPVVVTHAALDSQTTYIHAEHQAHDQLGILRREFSTHPLLVLGHTHRQWLFSEREATVGRGGKHPVDDGAHLLNPGSVGQSRQWEVSPRARFAVLDFRQRRAEFHAVGYDRRAARRALRECGLPSGSLHMRPSWAELARSARRRIWR